MQLTQVESLELIAASLALSHVDQQLENLRNQEPLGDNAVADQHRRDLEIERRPLIRWRKELMKIISGYHAPVSSECDEPAL